MSESVPVEGCASQIILEASDVNTKPICQRPAMRQHHTCAVMIGAVSVYHEKPRAELHPPPPQTFEAKDSRKL